MAKSRGWWPQSYDYLNKKQARGMSAKETALSAKDEAVAAAKNKAARTAAEKQSRRLAVDASAENRAIAKRMGSVSGYQKFLKRAGVSLLSPAGLAEGVAGATVKAMRASGAPMTPQEMMKKKGMPKGRIVKGTRRGERA